MSDEDPSTGAGDDGRAERPELVDAPEVVDDPLAAVAGLGGLGGLLETAQQMMASAQAAADEVVEGAAGGGLVRIRLDGHHDVKSVHIDPAAVDPDDPSMLEDLVHAALRDALERVRAGQQGALGGLDIGDLGDLGGLFGGQG